MRTNPLHFWVKLIFRIDLSPFLGLSYVGFKIGLGQFRLTSGFKIGLGHLRLTSNSSKSLNNTFNINLQTRINPMFWLMSGLPLRSKIGSDWVRLVLRVSLLRVQNRVGSGYKIGVHTSRSSCCRCSRRGCSWDLCRTTGTIGIFIPFLDKFLLPILRLMSDSVKEKKNYLMGNFLKPIQNSKLLF